MGFISKNKNRNLIKTTQNKNRYRKIKLLWGCARQLPAEHTPTIAEDDQYRTKHVVVHYIVIKYTSCDTVVFDYIQFSK